MNHTEVKNRDVGVDLLKIVACFIVVLCHYTQTVRNEVNILTEYNDIFNYYRSTFSIIDGVIIYFFRTFGHIGNTMFISASAWYLCNNKKTDSKKIYQILFDNLFISLIFLFIYSRLYNNIPESYLIQSRIPNLNANSWFISSYALVMVFILV